MNLRQRLILPLLLALAGPAAAVAPPIGDVMAGEFALQQGDLRAAARYYLLASQVSRDPGLAERATRIALLGDEPRLAGRALARWRALAPDDLAMHAAAISLALRQGEHESAMDEARALLARPGKAGFPVLLAALSEARGDEAVIARSVMRELFEQANLPADLSSWLRLAGLARRLDDRAFSSRVIEAALARFPQDPGARLLQATRLREAGEPAAARDKLLALSASGELPPDLRRAAASELALLGEPRLAAELLAEGPQDDASYGQRAAWLVAANDDAGLQALYRELAGIATAPPPSRRLLLGHVAEALQRWEDAARWYAGAARGPGHDLAMLRLARTQDQLGRIDDALDTLHELQANEAADGERVRDSYVFEAEVLERNGRAAAALAALDRGLGVFEDDPVLLYGRAMQHERGDRVDAALADLRRIIDEDPEDAQALNAYGYTLADRRREYAEALPYIERAYALEPESAPILDSLGWVHFQLGRREYGLELLQKAWDRLKDAEIAAHLGEALWGVGRKEEARAIWRAGAGIDADNPALKRALETYTP